MAAYRPRILALAVFALSATQIYAGTIDNCDRCVGINLGGPNPICGSDGYTYYNLEKLNCVNRCKGTNVQFARFGECGKSDAPTPQLPTNRGGCSCMKNIGYEQKIDQFCGSDGFTYYSQSEADCISSCYGYPIQRMHDGACAVPLIECTCQPSGPRDLLCGSDGQTYENRQALECSNYCKKQRVQERFKGKCGGIASYGAPIPGFGSSSY